MTRTTIAFDGSVLADGPLTGVARAFLSTLRAFAAGDERCVLLAPHAAAGRDELHAGIEVVAAPRSLLAKQFAWPRLLRRLGADLLHVPVAALPLRLPCPAVITVHDLPWRARPRLPRGDAPQLRHRLALQASARVAQVILVPSAATASDLANELPARVTARVHVVPHGVDPVAARAGSEPSSGLLVLGDDRPRKNHARIAAAHQRAQHLDARVPTLSFVGPPRAWVTEAEKDTLLRRATGLLQMSLHEGFGLPVLEAMARGVPVLCSNFGALAEVAGGAALLADPLDVEAMARAIVVLCTDQPRRVDLRARGLQRAATFTTQAAAAGWRRAHAVALRHDLAVGLP